MQCISPQEGKFFILIHDQNWAKLYDRHSHLLCGLGKMFYHYMYVHFLHPTIYYMMTCMIDHVSRNIFPCRFLKQQFVRLCCTSLGGYWYLQTPHEAISISFILVLIMTSFADIVSILVESMIGELTHELDVSLRRDNSHIFCITCSNGSMGGDMSNIATHLFSFGLGHEFYSHSMYNHEQVFDHVLLTHSTIYYSLVDVMIFSYYFPCYFLKLQWMRLCCVLLRHCLYHASSCKTFSILPIWILYDDHVVFIMDEMFWATLFSNVGRDILGGLLFILPLKGNTIVA